MFLGQSNKTSKERMSVGLSSGQISTLGRKVGVVDQSVYAQ